MAIQGNLKADQAPHSGRSAARRKLHLDVVGETANASANVTLLNLSATGVLLRTAEKLWIGERIRLAFPGDEIVSAKVVWTSDELFGCRFEKPIGPATLSAASLKSRFDEPAQPASLPPVEDSFGARLKRLRKQRSLSLQALADKVGVSKPALWKWERGDVRPRPAALAKVAAVLGVEAAELVFGRGSYGEGGEPAPLRDILDRAKTEIAASFGIDAAQVTITIGIRD